MTESAISRFFRIADNLPEKSALSFYAPNRGTQTSYSYRELARLSLEFASYFSSCGLIDRPIGILSQKNVSSYAGILGALSSRCHFVPLNPKLPVNRLLDISNIVEIKHFVTDTNELSRCLGLMAGIAKPTTCLYVDEVERIVKVAQHPDKNFTPISGKILEHPLETNDSHMAYIIFTSGSTGTPKGVMISHRNLRKYVDHMIVHYSLTEEDRFSQIYDLGFDPAIGDIFLALSTGATLCPLKSTDLLVLPEYMKNENITFWSSSPSFVKNANNAGLIKSGSFSHVRYSTFIGEKLQEFVARLWATAAPFSTIENLYGPAETTISVTRYKWDLTQNSSFPNGILPIGRPHNNQRIELVDQDLKAVPKGQVGEICISGDLVGQGYFNDPDTSHASFVRMNWDSADDNRWYRTGDLAFCDENNNLQFLGRNDWQFKLQGQRMEPGEIEAFFTEGTLPADAIAFPAFPDTYGDPQGVIVVLSKKPSAESLREIFEKMQQKLLPRFIPRNIFVLDPFPTNLSGKTDRKQIQNLLDKNQLVKIEDWRSNQKSINPTVFSF